MVCKKDDIIYNFVCDCPSNPHLVLSMPDQSCPMPHKSCPIPDQSCLIPDQSIPMPDQSYHTLTDLAPGKL